MTHKCYRCSTPIRPEYPWCDCKDGQCIVNGDCREVNVVTDVIVTDPPFGMAWSSGFGGIRGNAEVVGDDSTDVRDEILKRADGIPAIVFGTWKCQRPEGVKAILTWDKGPHVGAGDLNMPWKPNTEEIYVIGKGFSGHRGTSVLVFWASSPNFNSRLHPTEKPIALMKELINKCPGQTILDPFMGSGTTLVAAKQLGRHALGIEIEEKYAEIAAERLRQGVLF